MHGRASIPTDTPGCLLGFSLTTEYSTTQRRRRREGEKKRRREEEVVYYIMNDCYKLY